MKKALCWATAQTPPRLSNHCVRLMSVCALFLSLLGFHFSHSLVYLNCNMVVMWWPAPSHRCPTNYKHYLYFGLLSSALIKPATKCRPGKAVTAQGSLPVAKAFPQQSVLGPSPFSPTFSFSADSSKMWDLLPVATPTASSALPLSYFDFLPPAKHLVDIYGAVWHSFSCSHCWDSLPKHSSGW